MVSVLHALALARICLIVIRFGDRGGGLNRIKEGKFVAVSLILTIGNSPYGILSPQPCLGAV